MILVYLAVWKRPEITEICFMGIDRLRKSNLFPIEALAVISEVSMIPLCRKYEIRFTFYKNLPLGEKKNHGVKEALKLKWDYLLEIGSDDVLYTDVLKAYQKPISEGCEFFGFKDVLYINSETGDCRRYFRPRDTTAWGMGRMIKREVVERLWPLWPNEINRSMDNSSTKKLFQNGVFHKHIAVEKPMGIDIKSKENIWPFNPTVGEKFDLEKALEGLSIEEQSALLNIIKRNKVERQVY